MQDIARMTALGGVVAGVLAIVAIAPGAMRAVADEPVAAVAQTVEHLFPPPFDARVFRKYAIHFGPDVSTDIVASRSVTKIGFGRMTQVAIVTTASGTYSSDALVSPHIRYPGVDVRWRHRHEAPRTVRPVTDSFLVLK